ncbi:MAG: SBBP repeat-containing protein [Bradymonadaceae bacterium]|nr:SBBP repeat-containing protein [Lujinxingiaceae bacterium]
MRVLKPVGFVATTLLLTLWAPQPATALVNYSYSGFIGGDGDDRPHALVAGSDHTAYIAGNTTSNQINFPVTVGPDLTHNGVRDAFVARVNSSGNGLIYAGYIGGNQNDTAQGMDIDNDGQVVITGATQSTNNPVLIGPPYNNANSTYVAKVAANGASLIYAGYYINGITEAHSLAVSSDGLTYFAGRSESSSPLFPASVGPSLVYKGAGDAFVAKIAASGASLLYAGYIGGPAVDEAYGVAVDNAGAAYVTGYTQSVQPGFYVRTGPQLISGGDRDGFMAKVVPDGSDLEYAGFLGAGAGDEGHDLAIGTDNTAYVVGATASPTFPVVVGPRLVHSGGFDAFVGRLNVVGDAFHYLGYVGGDNEDKAYEVTTDSSKSAYFTGYTKSTAATFPVVDGPMLTLQGATSAFVAKTTPNGTDLVFSGYLGSIGQDFGQGIDLGPDGQVYVTGWVGSGTGFPVVSGPFTAASLGTINGFVTRFRHTPPDTCSPACTPGDICWVESCFTSCMTHPDCPELCFGFEGDSTYNRCVEGNAPCEGIDCGAQVCYGGSCFDSCTDDGDCVPPFACFANHCALTACSGVQCPIDESCYAGSCFDVCAEDDDCLDPMLCFDGRCSNDACHGVNCASSEVCYAGSCFDKCPCTVAGFSCYDERCATDVCQGVQCSSKQSCYEGSCFDDCVDTGDCTPPLICSNSICVGDLCAGVTCPGSETCHEGNCVLVCSADDQCDPAHHCYQGTCTSNSCVGIVCPGTQVCHIGTCFDSCASHDDCIEPMFCFDGRCALDTCEAKYFDYDTDHVFRAAGGHWPGVVQRSSPWHFPRPVLLASGGLPAITAALSATPPLTSKGRARAVLFLDRSTTPARYALALLHGRSTSTQGEASATYSIRYPSGQPAPSLLQAIGTVTQVVTSEGGFNHHQIQIHTAPGQHGGVILGYFGADIPWSAYVSASFSGDLSAWQFYSAETGSWLDLDAHEEMALRHVAIPSNVKLSVEVGVSPCRPGANVHGICGHGTVTSCTIGRLKCDQTVLPWNYEVCNGRDDTCNNIIDDVATMRFPMVSVREQGESNWTAWPTVDKAQSAGHFLNYTPHAGAIQEGSANVLSVGDATALQALDRSLMFFHRNTQNGVLSMPLVHGIFETDPALSATTSSPVGARIDFANALATYYDSSDLMFVAGYDDWVAPSNTAMRDDVPEAVHQDRYELAWTVRRWTAGASASREADAAIMQLTWPRGGNAQPLRFDLGVTLPTAIGNWRLYAPHLALRALNASKKLEVKVEHLPAALTMCMAESDANGCRITRYVCNAGGVIACPTPSAAACAAGGCQDLDFDGHLGYHPIDCPTGPDCDDNDYAVKPGATEVCDGKDTNCDDVVDGLAAGIGGCPAGGDVCGPAECGFRNACSCPSGSADCFCESGLSE